MPPIFACLCVACDQGEKQVRMESSPPEAAGPTSGSPEFSAVITCYFEEKTIDEFHAKLVAALDAIGRTYEIVLVNDGSTDGTWEKLKKLFESDRHVHAIVDLFKNSGQQAAMTAGMCVARGAVILLMDSDLQLDPAELPRLVAQFDKGYDIVTGFRKHRKDSLSRIVPSKLANVIMRKVSQTSLRDFGCTFKLYNAALIRGFDLGPFKIFNTPLVISKARRIAEIPVSHYPRKHGKSGWTFRKLWTFNMDNMVNLSDRPFQMLALLCFLAATLILLRIVVDLFSPFLVLKEVTNGLLLNTLLVSLLVTISVLCVIGEFSIRNFVTSQRIPGYVIREKIERDTE